MVCASSRLGLCSKPRRFQEHPFKGDRWIFQAEIEAGQTKVTRHGEKPVEHPHQKCSWWAIVKHTRSHFTEASKEDMIGAYGWSSFQGNFYVESKREPTHSSSEEDEDSEIPLRLRSRRTKVPAVITVEGLLEEAVERQVTGDESVPTLVPTRIAPQVLFRVKEKVLTLRTFYLVPWLRWCLLRGSERKVQPLGFSRLSFPLPEFYIL